MVALDVYVNVFTFSRSLRRVRAEVPIAVQRVDGVLDALSQNTLAGFVAENVGWEEHLNLEDSLRRLGS